jgi:hypothetical protein
MFKTVKKLAKAAVAGAVIGIAIRKVNNRVSGKNGKCK